MCVMSLAENFQCVRWVFIMKIDQVSCQSVTRGFADSSEPNPSRLIRLPEVMKRVGLSRSAIYKRMAEGSFPRSRSLSPKCAVWVQAEIDIWIAEISNIGVDPNTNKI
ncbi:helix-turn-helix transcriptional regulator [Sphingorhabdus pulchriflava]|jgi:prophage regulatory protein